MGNIAQKEWVRDKYSMKLKAKCYILSQHYSLSAIFPYSKSNDSALTDLKNFLVAAGGDT